MNEVTREKLSADFKAVIGDVDELVRATTRQTGEKIADLRERWGEVGSEPCRSVSQGVECYSCLPKTAWPPT